jgi:putative FmdB family regulatory protein
MTYNITGYTISVLMEGAHDMPIYEYVCEACEQSFEKLVRSSTKQSDITCPSCESQDVRKKMSSFASKVAGGASISSSSSASSGANCAPGGT